MNFRFRTTLLLLLPLASLVSRAAPGVTTDDRLHSFSVNTSQHAKEPYFTMFGPTGIMGWVYLNRIFVDSVDPGSPAAGLLQNGDYLLGVQGKDFPVVDPRILMGKAITEVEAGDGKLRLRVGNKGTERAVTVQLKTTGKYADTWPFDCAKSAGIRDNALAWLRDHQRTDGTFGLSVYTAMDGLFLLSSPSMADREAARRCMYGRLDGPPADCYSAWSYGYSAMALAEYFLATGDAVVLPRLEFYSKELTRGLAHSGTWGHGMAVNGVIGGYGELNCAGVVCLLSLVLMDECGVKVDPEGYEKAKNFFARFAGLGSVPYGNNDPWTKTPSSNGKDAVAALAFMVAGDPEKARAFADTVAMGYQYTEDAHTGAFWGVAWNPIAAIHGKPEFFRKSLDEQLWYYELQRRWDGGFQYLPNPENLTGITGWMGDPMTVTGGYGLMHALPWKSLRILGAAPGPFSKHADPSLQPAVELFKGKKWDAFDHALKALPAATPAAKRQAMELLAKRNDVQAQIDWTLATVEKLSGQSTLSAAAIERAKAMLKSAERLAGMDLEQANRIRKRLDSVTVASATSGSNGKRKPERKWVTLVPLAKDVSGESTGKTWRVHAWKGDISPLLDNLEPAGPAMRGWYLPDFKDSAWQQKPAPFRAHSAYPDAPFDGQAVSPVSHYDCMYQPRPLYNAYARLDFIVDDTAGIEAARIVQQNGHQYLRSEVYLNGYRVAAILRPNTCELSPEAVKLLRKGKNTFAIYLASCRGHLHDFDFGLEVVKP
jgi:surface antigen